MKIAKEHNPVDAGLERLGQPSPFACPECHGVLLQFKDASRMRVRCHTGHPYSIDSLVAAVSEGVEESLWNAGRLREQAEQARRQSDEVRQLVNAREPLAQETGEAKRRAES